MSPLGRTLIYAGLALILSGLVVAVAGRYNLPLGRLPGDIHVRGRNSSFSFPIVTCMLLSAAASLVLWIVNRFLR